MTDTSVLCAKCGREQFVSFSYCLANGWPKCCGQTMSLRMSPSLEVIDSAVADAFTPAIRRALGQSAPGGSQ